jgi:ankyrin repeat protein
VTQFFHEIFSSLLETPTLVKVLEALKSEENNREELDTALKGFLEDLLTQSKNRRDKMVYSGFSGNSLLHYVAYLNLHESCVLILKHYTESVQRSANMNGITPLHFAVQQGSFAILKQLLEVNAPIHAKDCVGQTALDYATIMMREEMIQLLNEKAEQLEIAERGKFTISLSPTSTSNSS